MEKSGVIIIFNPHRSVLKCSFQTSAALLLLLYLPALGLRSEALPAISEAASDVCLLLVAAGPSLLMGGQGYTARP